MYLKTKQNKMERTKTIKKFKENKTEAMYRVLINLLIKNDFIMVFSIDNFQF